MTILDDADKLTAIDRNESYGPPKENFFRIAVMWSVLFKRQVTEREVALAMVLVKIARDMECPRRDNLVDIAGYARTAEMLEE